MNTQEHEWPYWLQEWTSCPTECTGEEQLPTGPWPTCSKVQAKPWCLQWEAAREACSHRGKAGEEPASGGFTHLHQALQTCHSLRTTVKRAGYGLSILVPGAGKAISLPRWNGHEGRGRALNSICPGAKSPGRSAEFPPNCHLGRDHSLCWGAIRAHQMAVAPPSPVKKTKNVSSHGHMPLEGRRTLPSAENTAVSLKSNESSPLPG